MYVGDIVVSRENDHRLETNLGEPVRNRESWTVDAIATDGSLTVSSNTGSGTVTLPTEYATEHVRLGYAATEHGNQGDTVDVGIELATVATTHRGLYVGATRGRDDNKILVVTDSNDLDDAREILRYVLTSNRSDVPAVTQRRLLAEMERSAAPRRPKLTPRCSIPPWFADLRSEVGRRLAASNAEVDEERRQLEDVHERIVDAKHELAEARRAMEPFRPAIDQAREDVDRAQQEMWSAHAAERRAGRLKRPAARRAAKQADEALAVAQERLADARKVTAPVQERVDLAWSVIDSGESSISTLRTLQGWGGSETRRDDLMRLDGALSTWCSWAMGEPVADDGLGNALTIMRADHSPDRKQPLNCLVVAVADWAERFHPALTRQFEANSTPQQVMGVEL